MASGLSKNDPNNAVIDSEKSGIRPGFLGGSGGGDKPSGLTGESSDSEKTEIEGLIKEVKDALEKDNIDDIKKAKDKLQEKAMALASRVYEEAAKSNQNASNNEI